MESPPLSPTVSSNFTAFANAQASVEEKLADYQPCEPGDDTAEFLRIFFKYLPREGQVNLAEDIDYCRDNTELKQLAESLDTGLLRPMLATGGRTPAMTTSPRVGVEDSIENLDSLDLESTRRAAQGKLCRNCLRRDGQRCIVTGYWNTDFDFPPNAVDAPLQAAHIIPFSLGHFENQDERHQMSIIWVNIFRYFPNLRSRLNFTPEDINQEDNVMMMFSPLHEQFGSFHFILEPTSTPHRYHIKLFSKFPSAYKMHLPRSRYITITSHDQRYPLPNPSLIAIHAAIGNILHASGRGEKIESFMRDLGAGGLGLVKDGSTDIGDLLSVSSLSLLTSVENQGQHPARGKGKKASARTVLSGGAENRRPKVNENQRPKGGTH